MLVPFVIFDLPVGLLIDKYHIPKRTLLYVGILILSISTFLISTITSTSLSLWAIVLFMTRTGASMVETTTEIYFFTHIKEEEAYLLGIFRDMTPIAYIVAPLLATVIFAFLPFNHLFAVLAIITLSAFYYIGNLKHNHDQVINTNEYSLPNQNQ